MKKLLIAALAALASVGLPFAATAADRTLTEDTVWTEMQSGVTDLNGHTLTLNISATATSATSLEVTSPSDGANAGTFCVNVASGKTYTSNVKMTGKVAFVKEGAGTYVQNVASTATEGGTVSAGIVKAGVYSAFKTDTTMTVENGAAFNINGKAHKDYPMALNYVIAGDGPDGKGALRSESADIGRDTDQMKSLTLSGDALVSSTKHFGMSKQETLTLNGHTLTINYTAGKYFLLVNMVEGNAAGGTIHVSNGQLHPYWSAKSSEVINLPNVDVVIDGSQSVCYLDYYPATATFKSLTLKNGGSIAYKKREKILVSVTDFYVLPGSTLDLKAGTSGKNLIFSCSTMTIDGGTLLATLGTSIALPTCTQTVLAGSKVQIPLTGFVTPGSYKLFTGFSGEVENLTPVYDASYGNVITLRKSGTDLYADVAAETLKWKGGSGNWSDKNWLNASGETVNWTEGVIADFGGAESGTVTVGSDVTPTSVIPGDGFTFTGSGKIKVDAIEVASGATATFAHIGNGTAFAKTGAGTLRIGAESPATQTVNVNGGSLVLTEDAVWNAITVNVAKDATFGGSDTTVKVKSFLPVSGAALGAGLTLSSDDFYSGDDYFNGKTVVVNGIWNVNTNTTSNGSYYFMAKGATFRGSGTMVSESFGINTGKVCAFDGVTLIATGRADGSQRYLLGRMWGSFTVSDVTLKMKGGDFSNFSANSGSVNVTDGKTLTIDTRDADDPETGRTYTMNANGSYNRIAASAGKLRKIGAGTLVFDYDLPLTGASTVEGGVLKMNANCAAPLTVELDADAADDATLRVPGSCAFSAAGGVTLGTGAWLDLTAGDDAAEPAANAVTMAGPLTVTDDAKISYEITSTGGDVVDFSGDDGLSVAAGKKITLDVRIDDEWKAGAYKLIGKGVTSLDPFDLQLSGAKVEASLAIREGALWIDLEQPLPEGSLVWTGKGSDNKWSTAANWKGNVAPTAATSYLYFDGDAQVATENDISDLQVSKIVFRPGAGAFVLGGAEIVCGAIENGSAHVQTIGVPLASSALTVGSSAVGFVLTGSHPGLTGSLVLESGSLVLKDFAAANLTECPMQEIVIAGVCALPSVSFDPVSQTLAFAEGVTAAEVSFLDFKNYMTNSNFTIPEGMTVRLVRTGDDNPYFWIYDKERKIYINGTLDMPGIGLAAGRTNQDRSHMYVQGTGTGVVNVRQLAPENVARLHLGKLRVNFTGNQWLTPDQSHLYLDEGLTLGVKGTDSEGFGAFAAHCHIGGKVTVDTCDVADGTPRTFRFHQSITQNDNGSDGSLRKVGAGTLAFEPGNDDYNKGEYLITGDVAAEGGTLRFGAKCLATNLTVAAGARLEMAKVATNNVTVAAGGVFVAPKDAKIAFANAALTLAAGAALEYEVARAEDGGVSFAPVTLGADAQLVLPEEGIVTIRFSDETKVRSGDKLTLVTGADLTAADLPKFTLASPLGKLAVEDGNLVFEKTSAFLFIIR